MLHSQMKKKLQLQLFWHNVVMIPVPHFQGPLLKSFSFTYNFLHLFYPFLIAFFSPIFTVNSNNIHFVELLRCVNASVTFPERGVRIVNVVQITSCCKITTNYT